MQVHRSCLKATVPNLFLDRAASEKNIVQTIMIYCRNERNSGTVRLLKTRGTKQIEWRLPNWVLEVYRID